MCRFMLCNDLLLELTFSTPRDDNLFCCSHSDDDADD